MPSGMKLSKLTFLHFFIISLHRIEIKSSNIPDLNETPNQDWTDIPDQNENPEYQRTQTETHNVPAGSNAGMTNLTDPIENPVQLSKQTQNAGSSSKLSPFPDLDDKKQRLYEVLFKKACINNAYEPKYFPWEEIHYIDTEKRKRLRNLCARIWGPAEIDIQTPFCEIDTHVRSLYTKFKVKFFNSKKTRDRKGDFLECKCEMIHSVRGRKVKGTKVNFFIIKYNQTHYFTLRNLRLGQMKITGLKRDPI